MEQVLRRFDVIRSLLGRMLGMHLKLESQNLATKYLAAELAGSLIPIPDIVQTRSSLWHSV